MYIYFCRLERQGHCLCQRMRAGELKNIGTLSGYACVFAPSTCKGRKGTPTGGKRRHKGTKGSQRDP